MLRCPILTLQDATAEALEIALVQNDERMFMNSTEGGVIEATLARYDRKASPNLDVWLKGYCGEEHKTARVTREGTNVTPIIAVSICSQPDVLQKMMANDAAAKRGFVPRFLKIIPPSSVGYREMNPEPCPDSAREQFRARMRRLLGLPVPIPKAEGGLGPVICRMGADASEEFMGFRRAVEASLREGAELEDHQQWGSKLSGAISRIALTLHALSHWGAEKSTPKLSDEISGPTMRAAIAWAPGLIAGEKRAAAVAQLDQTAVLAARVLSWIRKNRRREFSHREAHTARRCAAAPGSRDFKPILQRLVDTGHLRPLPSQRKNGAGRSPSPSYRVNPSLLQCGEASEATQSTPRTRSGGHSAYSARGDAGPGNLQECPSTGNDGRNASVPPNDELFDAGECPVS